MLLKIVLCNNSEGYVIGLQHEIILLSIQIVYSYVVCQESNDTECVAPQLALL